MFVLIAKDQVCVSSLNVSSANHFLQILQSMIFFGSFHTLDYSLQSYCVIVSTGEVIDEKDKCPQCKGQKVVQDKKMLEVHVEKGMQHGQKITFQGEADEAV
jgi:DnaJ-class molecular chaperone